ncbi:MAG: hypothetical protein R3C61_02505 [Bacteroidia bacterium]
MAIRFKAEMMCLAILILFFPRPPLSAQNPATTNGYILSYSGDTTFGFVRPGNQFKNQRRIDFTDLLGVQTIYQSDRIAGYGYEDQHYESLPTPYHFAGLFSDSTLFLQRRIAGPASLYRYYKQHSAFTLQKGPSYFELVKKPDGTFHEVSLAFKWKRVAWIFSDYPELAREIEKGLYTPQEMDKIVETYNRWYISR